MISFLPQTLLGIIPVNTIYQQIVVLLLYIETVAVLTILSTLILSITCNSFNYKIGDLVMFYSNIIVAVTVLTALICMFIDLSIR